MAAGSSAPELFTSLAAVFSSPSSDCPGATGAENVGVGTIVGSAIFNILVIIGATAMLAGNVLVLQWKPLVRDTCFYGEIYYSDALLELDERGRVDGDMLLMLHHHVRPFRTRAEL